MTLPITSEEEGLYRGWQSRCAARFASAIFEVLLSQLALAAGRACVRGCACACAGRLGIIVRNADLRRVAEFPDTPV